MSMMYRLSGKSVLRGHGALLFVLLPLIVAQNAYATNGIEPIGVSQQARMRGGADVAVGDSALSQIDNPATLSLQPREVMSFDFAGQVIFPNCKWTGPFGTYKSRIDAVPLANFGIAQPINDELTFGLAVQSKAGIASRYEMRHLLIPWVERRVGSDLKDISLSANAAYAITDKLSVGIGGRFEMATAEFSTVLGPVDVDFGRGYAYGGGFQLGLHYQAREDLAFGLGYRSTTWFGDLSGGDVDASLFGFLPLSLGSGNIDELRLPQKVSAGVAWDVTKKLKLVGESRWLNYSYSSFNNMTVATDGIVDLRVPMPLDYDDQWVFIIGGEYKLDEHWTLGAGYQYANNPVSSSSLCPIGSIIAQHHITVGARYKKDNWWVGGGYIVALPNSMHASGRTRIPFGIDHAVGKTEQVQHSLSVGFGFGW